MALLTRLEITCRSRVGSVAAPGYRIDTGASVLTMPDLIDEALAARTGLDPDTDLYPGLLAAVLGCALRVTLHRWYRRGGEEPIDRLFGEAVDALAAGLPGPPAA